MVIHLLYLFLYFSGQSYLYTSTCKEKTTMISYSAKIKSHKLSSFFDPEEEDEEVSKE